MQFSLRTLMLVMLVVAVLCAVLFTFPGWLTGRVMATVTSLLPSLLVIAAVYGDGERRVFALGAATTYLAVALRDRSWLSSYGNGLTEFVGGLFLLLLLGGSGYTCVWFRRWLERVPKD